MRPLLQQQEPYQAEKSLNSIAEAEDSVFCFLFEPFSDEPTSVAVPVLAVRAFRYFPTPLPEIEGSVTPVLGLLYHEPTLS